MPIQGPSVMDISQIFIFMYNCPMSKKKSATTQFHFNKLSDEEIKEWAKILVINKLSMKIWSKGNEKDAIKFFPTKYEPAEKKLWLSLKDGKSELIGTEIFLKGEWEGVHFFGQTELLYDDREKSHYLILEGEFYKSQQRTMLRVRSQPELGVTIKVEIGDKEYEGLDISFGGTSFTTEDEDEFEMDQLLEKFNIILGRETFVIPRGKIVKIFEGEEGKKNIALNFIKLTHDTEVNLTKKVEALNKEIAKKKAK